MRNEAAARAAGAEEEFEAIRALIASDPEAYPSEAYDFLTKDAFIDALAVVVARAVWLNAANVYAMVPLVDLLPVVGAPPPGGEPRGGGRRRSRGAGRAGEGCRGGGLRRRHRVRHGDLRVRGAPDRPGGGHRPARA